ncbi:MAG: metallophosphoesterase family protein [Carbonactinosporaceae bacterium]
MGKAKKAVLALSALLLTATMAGASVPPSAAAEEPLFTFVSMPDFLNTDIGDARIREGRGWDPGDPNSINGRWRQALDVILDDVAAENPDAVLVAGDLVEGHWDVDIDNTGIFGPVGTSSQRLRAITNAGNLYYGEWRRRFTNRNLTVYPALGDHEIGDNPWPEGSFKLRAVPTYKRVWARNFTTFWGDGNRFAMRPVGTAYEDTAYAVRIANTLIVSVDVFRRSKTGVTATVNDGQLRWLDETLTEARADGVKHILVQGHTPVLIPVRYAHSSKMRLKGGSDSRFWQTLQRHDVDLYLCGEVHDMTTLTDGVVQVSHGALAYWGEENYLLGRVYADRIELELKQFDGRVTDSDKMWNTSHKRPHEGVEFQPGPAVVGTMTIDKSTGTTVRRDRSGRLTDGESAEENGDDGVL